MTHLAAGFGIRRRQQRLLHQSTQLAAVEHAVSERVTRARVQEWRTSALRAGVITGRAACSTTASVSLRVACSSSSSSSLDEALPMTRAYKCTSHTLSANRFHETTDKHARTISRSLMAGVALLPLVRTAARTESLNMALTGACGATAGFSRANRSSRPSVSQAFKAERRETTCVGECEHPCRAALP